MAVPSIQPPSGAGRGGRPAFTLVELLVVIGVIAVLISILLPALNRAREAAVLVQCQSNMRQVGAAMLIYANQNSGYVVPGKVASVNGYFTGPGAGENTQLWVHKLVEAKLIPPGAVPPGGSTYVDPTRSPLLQCPAGGRGWFGYFPSIEVAGFERRPGLTDGTTHRYANKKFVKLRPASEYILLSEAKNGRQTYPFFTNLTGSNMSNNNNGWFVPHNKMTRVNILCADGHVQTGTYRPPVANLNGLPSVTLDVTQFDPETRRLKWQAP